MNFQKTNVKKKKKNYSSTKSRIYDNSTTRYYNNSKRRKKTFDFPATTLTTMVLTTKKTIRDSELRCAGKNPQQPKSQAE